MIHCKTMKICFNYAQQLRYYCSAS